jgi:NAD(P)-dependent dehydrogenase (short-subunit alcohol dehydrogenase family)/acyl dehydratase
MERSCSFEVDVTAGNVEAFSQLSGDRNPMHTSAEYARNTEYGRPIVHGAFLVGLVSRVLGMHIPGERSVILSLSVRFPKPLFYPARVQVSANLKHFNPERGTGAVHVAISDLERRWTVLESEVLFGLHAVTRESEPRSVTPAEPSDESAVRMPPHPIAGTGRSRLLVTGGTGGIGRQLLPDLAAIYDVTAVSRKAAAETNAPRAALPHIDLHQVDLEEEGAFERFLEAHDPAEFYGVLHLSVPAMSRAFASDDLPGVRQHLRHAVEVPLLIARWARQAGSTVRRLVLVGSTAGSTRPRPELGAYSLGKAAMEHLARLLTADLAAQGATVNIVVPSVVPVGLNEGLSERARNTLIGKTATGRLVEPSDIGAVITFLLSEAASQVNGATIAVDGGSEE